MSRVKGWAPWKPQKKTRQRLVHIDAIIEDYAEQLPLTVRQIGYILMGRGQMSKADHGTLGEMMVRARRSGRIDHAHIRDDGINTAKAVGFQTASAVRRLADAVIDQAAFLPSTGQPVGQLILCEAAGMVPQLAKVAGDFGVDVISSGGYESLTVKIDLAQVLAKAGRPMVVWQVGDFDPSGVNIFSVLNEDVALLAGEADVTFRRLALTAAQIAELGLPTEKPNPEDKRPFEADFTAQVEAIPPDVLARILRDALSENFDFELRDELESIFMEELKNG